MIAFPSDAPLEQVVRAFSAPESAQEKVTVHELTPLFAVIAAPRRHSREGGNPVLQRFI